MEMRFTYLFIIVLFYSIDLNSQTWEQVGEGFDWNVYDLTSFNGNLYACGRLGPASRGVYMWDGVQWINTGSIFGIHSPLSIEAYQSELYTSGDFTGPNGSPTKVFRLEGEEWVQQGANFTGADWNSVKTLKQYENQLFAGGQFEMIGGDSIRNIAAWDGNVWNNVGEGLPDLVVELDIFQNSLIACHYKYDTLVDNNSNTYIDLRTKLQRWDGNVWIDLDTIFDNKHVYLLGVSDSGLIFGSADTIHGVPINNIGIWDGSNVYSIGDSLFTSYSVATEFNDEIYVACQISTDNPFSNASRIRKLVNTEWVNVGGLFNDHILALHQHEDVLFIGGFFDEYEGAEMNYVAMLGSVLDVEIIGEDNKLDISPNPTYGSIEIKSNGELIESLDILSNDGQKMLEIDNINESEINVHLDYVPTGLCFIRVFTKNGRVIVKKVIKY